MPELPPFLGSVPAWITAGGVATLVWVVINGGLGWRKLRNADESDIRDHYADEVKALREKLNRQEQHFMALETHWREMVDASDRRHEECEAARQTLRVELSAMHDEIAGLKRQIAASSADTVIRLGDAPLAQESAERVKKITDNDK
jgi:biopolymer transport protein ExbB/TolQ